MQILLFVIAVLGAAIADSIPDESNISDIDASNAYSIDLDPGSDSNLNAANSPSTGIFLGASIATEPKPDTTVSNPSSMSDQCPCISAPSPVAKAPPKPRCAWFFWPVCCTGENHGRNRKITECFECMRYP